MALFDSLLSLLPLLLFSHGWFSPGAGVAALLSNGLVSHGLTGHGLPAPLAAGMPLEVLPFIVGTIAILTTGVVVLIPVAGFTARFALKPLIEQIIRLRDGDTQYKGLSQLDHRTAALEQRIQQLEAQLTRLSQPALPPGVGVTGNQSGSYPPVWPMSQAGQQTGSQPGQLYGASQAGGQGAPSGVVPVDQNPAGAVTPYPGVRSSGDPRRDALDDELGRLGMQAAGQGRTGRA